MKGDLISKLPEPGMSLNTHQSSFTLIPVYQYTSTTCETNCEYVTRLIMESLTCTSSLEGYWFCCYILVPDRQVEWASW